MREHQADLLRREGGLEEIIRNNWDPVETARAIREILELPK